MANGNPFVIDTGFQQNVLPAAEGLISDYGERLKQEKLMEAQQKKQAEINDVLGSNDFDRISKYMASNPQLAPAIESAFNFKNEATKQNAVQTAFRLKRGEDPKKVLMDRAAFVQSQGGDPSDTLDAINDSPEDVEKIANLLLVEHGTPAMLKAIESMRQSKPFEQARAEGLEGYSFDPNTGQFSIDQKTKEILETKAAEKAAKGTPLKAGDRKGINKDVTDLTKDARMITSTAKDLRRLGEIKSGPASIALVFKFMKALDPTSVVREGEFATAENSAGVPEGIRNIYNRLANGERLGDKQISEFINTADQLSESAAGSAYTEVSGYLDSYEDTIPQSFKDKLLKRIPKVGISEKTKNQESKSDEVIMWDDL